MAAAEPTPPPALSIKALGRDFNEATVLRGVELELAAGGSLAILGPNGAGKTTLLRIIAGLLRPSRGSLSVLGAELPRGRWQLRGRVGMLGHAPLLYRELSGRENLRFAARLHGLKDDGEGPIEALLEQVGMSRRADLRVEEMSAGMVQRLSLCRALLPQPELLLADEPLSHLDPGARRELAPLLGPAPGRTRVIVSHDPSTAQTEPGMVLGLGANGSQAFYIDSGELDLTILETLYGGGPK